MNGKHWGSPTSKNIQDLQNLHYKVCKMYVNKKDSIFLLHFYINIRNKLVIIIK